MTDDYTHWYRLELLPVHSEKLFGYKNEVDRSDDNAGYDCYCTETYTRGNVNLPVTGYLIPLGIKARLVHIDANTMKERDSHFWLAPRSSICKTGLFMANSMGVIDKTYRGELKGPVYGEGAIKEGDRIFQIIAPDMGWIREIRIVESLSETSRGEGGFGSTGK